MSTLYRAIIASGLFFGTVTAFSPSAFASTTINLGGTVTSIVTMTTTATSNAANLDLPNGAETKVVQVANINYLTNDFEGLTITATPGTLTKTGGQTPIEFQVKLLGDGAIPSSGDFASGNTTYATTTAGTGDADLYIKYTTAVYQDPGAYSGSISVTVADNS